MRASVRETAAKNVAQLDAKMRPKVAWIRETRAPVNGPQGPGDHDRPGTSLRVRAAAT